MFLNKVICILGPTCSGKTKLSLNISQKYKIEILSVDAYMIYKNMTIGTDKPTMYYLNKTKHHFIDILEPTETYSVFKFCCDAYNILKLCWENNSIPIFVGGNLMYMWVFQNFFLKYNKFDKKCTFLNIGLLPVNKDILLKNIETRLSRMLKKNFIDEVENLIIKYKININSNSIKAIGYKELYLYLNSKMNLNTALEQIIQSTFNLSNKQILWLKKWHNMFYFNLITKNDTNIICKLINNYLNK